MDPGRVRRPRLRDDERLRRTGGGSLHANTHASAPLAVRMRPRTLDELVGQEQLRAPGSPLRRLVEGDQPMSLLLWGPPGTGKTTIAAIVSQQTDRRFVEVSAVSAGVKEVRAAIDAARAELVASGRETVLFVDEVHRFSKAPAGRAPAGGREPLVTLTAATTENPLQRDLPAARSQPCCCAWSPDRRRRPGGPAQAISDERGLGGAVAVDTTRWTTWCGLAGG